MTECNECGNPAGGHNLGCRIGHTNDKKEIERLRTAIFNTINDLNRKSPNIRSIRTYLGSVYNFTA